MAVGRGGAARNEVLAALDVGTSKVCCFLAKTGASGGIRVVGIGHQAARGLSGGTVADMGAAEQSIRAAVDAAERMAGQTIEHVFVNLSGGQPTSHRIVVEVSVDGHEVGDADLHRMIDAAREGHQTEERRIVHTIPINYAIDGTNGIRDPRGMFGSRLGVTMHLVTLADGPLRNLALCIERGHLGMERVIVSPYAAGLATLVDDEIDLGATVIDMGAGTTTVGVFLAGSLVFADCTPLGGQHVTSDIARGLATSARHAERFKTLYGSVIPSPTDERQLLDVPQLGEEDSEEIHQVPRSMLVGIIRPRVEEILEIVRARLEDAGLGRGSSRRVVLTGGASQLQGLRELTAHMLDKQVRIGRPIHIDGLADAMGGPAFATCAGLLRYAAEGSLEATHGYANHAGAGDGPWSRLGHWLRENF